MENNRSSVTRPPVSNSSLFSQPKQVSQNQQQQSHTTAGSVRQASRSDTSAKPNGISDTSGSSNGLSRETGRPESVNQASSSKTAEPSNLSNMGDSEKIQSKAPIFDPKDDVSGMVKSFVREWLCLNYFANVAHQGPAIRFNQDTRMCHMRRLSGTVL